jgi:hypothetical protein
MLIFSPSRPSVLLELAFLTSLLALVTFSEVKRQFGFLAGAVAGVLLICLPIVQTYSDEVMAESLLTLVSFAAVIYFARFLESESWQDSALFGVFASLAIMTKGNGWDLALIPPIALLLTRNFRIVLSRVFWWPALIVSVVCVPWQLLTLSLAQRGWDGGDKPNLVYTTRAARELLVSLVNLLGWGLAPFIVIGITVTVVIPFFQKKVRPEWAVMTGLILAALVFHAIVPAGVEPRKLIIAIPALIMFLFAGCAWIATKTRLNPAIVMVAAVAIFAVQEFTIPVEIHYGYSDAAHFISDHPELQDRTILVSSDRDGEGMLVSELAMRDKQLDHRILRATKVLASTDWNGKVYQCYYGTPEALLRYLRTAGVNLVVSDTLPGAISFEHQDILNQTIAKYPDSLKLIASFHGDVPGAVNIYRVAGE